MKIRYLSLIVLLVMSVFAPMQAQTYDNLWKELEVLERKDLPKSVISEAMKIYDKAKAEQNVPQMMKAYLTAMQYRSLLTPDSLKVDMNGLEQWASQTGSMEDKAILYSILGEMTMPADVKKGLGYLQASLMCYIAGHDMLDADATENPVRIRVVFRLDKKCLIIFVNLMFNLQAAQTFHFLGT